VKLACSLLVRQDQWELALTVDLAETAVQELRKAQGGIHKEERVRGVLGEILDQEETSLVVVVRRMACQGMEEDHRDPTVVDRMVGIEDYDDQRQEAYWEAKVLENVGELGSVGELDAEVEKELEKLEDLGMLGGAIGLGWMAADGERSVQKLISRCLESRYITRNIDGS
jgi:hypothetical protein